MPITINSSFFIQKNILKKVWELKKDYYLCITNLL